ncbi:MAG: hypothetical protein GDA36_10590 [Rhodobacteraceae bacterium]|nr:hypothetical protein [Paracoccaceae bacterium]
MFGGSFDSAILSGPLALLVLTVGKAVLVVWLCDCRCLRGRFCLIATIASWAFCFGQPELPGTVQVKGLPHRGIDIAQSESGV